MTDTPSASPSITRSATAKPRGKSNGSSFVALAVVGLVLLCALGGVAMVINRRSRRQGVLG
jgi:flagellar basal body-associated protein FliL